MQWLRRRLLSVLGHAEVLILRELAVGLAAGGMMCVMVALIRLLTRGEIDTRLWSAQVSDTGSTVERGAIRLFVEHYNSIRDESIDI